MHPDDFDETIIDVDDLVAQITVGSRDWDDKVSAFLPVLFDEVALPAEATLLGMPVEVTEFDFLGDGRGLLARCIRADADQYLALVDLEFPPGSVAAWLHAAYRRLLGAEPRSMVPPPDWEFQPDWL